jgi:hypothetical protein
MTMNRRKFLLSGVAALAATATPALADRQCVQAVTRRGFVNLQIAAMARNDTFYRTVEGNARVQRVLETGPRIYDGLVAGHFQPIRRPIEVTVMLWMRPGYDRASAVHDGANGLEEFSFTNVGARLDCNLRRVGHEAFVRNLRRLPALTNVSGLDTPHFAFRGTIRSYGIGWSLSYDFLREVQYIMICPDAATLWPRRTDGRDEGLIITPEEIGRWIRSQHTYALTGIIDSV